MPLHPINPTTMQIPNRSAIQKEESTMEVNTTLSDSMKILEIMKININTMSKPFRNEIVDLD